MKGFCWACYRYHYRALCGGAAAFARERGADGGVGADDTGGDVGAVGSLAVDPRNIGGYANEQTHT